MSRYWYFFNGTQAEEQDPTKYSRVSGVPSLGCGVGQTLCGIYVHKNPGTGKPVEAEITEFSVLFDYIAAARFAAGTPYPSAKPFVYLRNPA